MNSDFEKRLQGQPLRQPPGEWRKRILSPAQTSSQPAWWREWLWPCPQAWAGLAAAWLIIFGLNFAAGTSSAKPEPKLALSHEEILDLKRQEQMLAEIISPTETAEAPKPRSDTRRNEVVV